MEGTPVGAFLRARRELVQPEDVGITRGPHRRVPGLRREEVARLAGISQEYYLRLEQGRDYQPSTQVLAALGRALLLDDDSLRYLHRLACPAPKSDHGREDAERVADGLLQLLTQWSDTPAYITDSTLDVVAANELAVAMAPGYVEVGANLLTRIFTDVRREPYPQAWAGLMGDLVACLRYHADLDSPRLREIVGLLSIRSDEFRRLWAAHEARPMGGGYGLTFVDPLGWVNLRRQTFELPGGIGHQLTVFFGDAGSPEASAIAFLRARLQERPHSAATRAQRDEVQDERSRMRFTAARDESAAASRRKTMSS